MKCSCGMDLRRYRLEDRGSIAIQDNEGLYLAAMAEDLLCYTLTGLIPYHEVYCRVKRLPEIPDTSWRHKHLMTGFRKPRCYDDKLARLVMSNK